MKKMIAMLLALVMLLSLAACGSEEPKTDSDGEVNDVVQTQGEDKNDETNSNDVQQNTPILSDEISLENLMNYPVTPEDQFECMDIGDGTCMLIKYSGDNPIVVLPETWYGMKITQIGGAFCNDSIVKAIRLSDSVNSLTKNPFANNENLEIVVFGSGMRTVCDSAFQNCNNLKTVVLNDGLESIGLFGFAACDNFMSIEIPVSVTDIHEDAFFALPEEFVIIGEAGSVAEQHAKDVGINFQTK